MALGLITFKFDICNRNAVGTAVARAPVDPEVDGSNPLGVSPLNLVFDVISAPFLGILNPVSDKTSLKKKVYRL